ncbi:unnamed protein product [Boreogadus saida]
MTMFQHSNKKCFTIESLVGKDTSNNSASPAGEHEPIRPTALRFTESIHSAPFGTCFQNSGRSIYPSPDMMFQDPGTHTQNSGLPLHPLQMPSQTFFSPHQRDALNFYPWVLRNKFLGHRFPVYIKSRRQRLIGQPHAEVKVKVWFQNRRTKHKRQKLEEESPEAQQKRKGSQHVSRWRVATQQGSPDHIDVISDD